MKRILSVVGARPNFMKVAPLHRAFATYAGKVEHSICHTGQHYDASMSDAFFQDLEMPQPRFFLGVGSGSHAQQTARVMVEFEKVLEEYAPDLVIVVGDVNSTIACVLTATKMHIATAHVEAGLRSFDRSMPEEINRMATDAICDYCFVTEQSGMDHLTREGWQANRVFFVGNTMIDSLHYALPKANQSTIVSELSLRPNDYVLMTLHRPSNVDDEAQLRMLLELFAELSAERQVVFPVHPRTRKNIQDFGLQQLVDVHANIKLIDPQGYINFLSLMSNADFVMTDSGGIQEETTALRIPCLTLRTTTERPSTVDIGSNILLDPSAEAIRREMKLLLSGKRKQGQIPPLWDGHAAERITRVVVDSILAVEH